MGHRVSQMSTNSKLRKQTPFSKISEDVDLSLSCSAPAGNRQKCREFQHAGLRHAYTQRRPGKRLVEITRKCIEVDRVHDTVVVCIAVDPGFAGIAPEVARQTIAVNRIEQAIKH